MTPERREGHAHDHDPSPARLDPVESATTISPVLRARADEAEALGTLPPDVVEQAERLGLTTMVLPRALGGLQADPSSIMAAIETTAPTPTAAAAGPS